MTFAALASFEAFQKHRILAAETTLLLCNKNGIELRENKRVGRDYIALRRLHPAPYSLKPVPAEKKFPNPHELRNLG
jgi:hypothetical protein